MGQDAQWLFLTLHDGRIKVLRDELPTKRAARKMSKAAYYAEHGDELRAKGRVRDAERRAAKKARREREHYVAML